MPTIVTGRYGAVSIPSGISDLSAFRQWVYFADLPERLPIHFLRGDVWVDCERADSLANVRIRGALAAVLASRARVARGGTFATSGMLWSNDRAGFATLPDGFFMSKEALKTGRVRFSNGGNPRASATEVIGTPDMVFEIVSRASEEKDTDWLMSGYFEAEVPEYWLIDVRDGVRFDVYKRGKKEFVAVRKPGGWAKSAVLGKSFRLTQTEDEVGEPDFTLEVR